MVRAPSHLSGQHPGFHFSDSTWSIYPFGKKNMLAANGAFNVASLSPPPEAGVWFDGMAIETGNSDSSHCDVELSRWAFQKHWGKSLILNHYWELSGYWDTSIGIWNTETSSSNKNILDVGFTPVLRCTFTGLRNSTPYLEAGVGAHVLSHSSVSSFRQLGSAFEFGEHFGIGILIGRRNRFDLSYRFQHLSNAGLNAPNRGINFHILRLGHYF